MCSISINYQGCIFNLVLILGPEARHSEADCAKGIGGALKIFFGQ